MKFLWYATVLLVTQIGPNFGQGQQWQWFGSDNPMCQARMPPCPNKDALSCCMYPELFFKRTKRECKNNALQVKKSDGSVTYFEDSCFLTCLFKSSGYDSNKNISGDFILKSIPANDGGITGFTGLRVEADETVERCKNYYVRADNVQSFANLYRKTLNQIDPKRPLCNLKLAAIWDCVYSYLMMNCPDMLFTQTSVCENLKSFVGRCYFWGADYINNPY